jgi:hypothetical protein
MENAFCMDLRISTPMLLFNSCSRRSLIGAFLALWCVGLTMGAQALWKYSSTPGETGSVPERWPADAPFQPTSGRATMVMLAHPHCPCTRASLVELTQLAARGGAEPWVLFVRPQGAEEGWERAGAWKSATDIPGAHVLVDVDGDAARAFGARTSGHVLFYDAAGVLQFSGGITASRGQQGPSSGSEAILAVLRGEGSKPHEAPTYGCPLINESATQ